MIRYREVRPSARLQPLIKHFWILEYDAADAAPQRVVPDGRPELILNWGPPLESFQAGQWQTQPRCFLAGQLEGPLLLRSKGPAKMLGIGFHPHGAARVFAPPMHELRGRFTPVDELSVALSRNLARSLDATDPIAAVEAALLSNPKNPRSHDVLVVEAVRRITLSHGGLDLASLARELGLSLRQFERRFQSVVGLPPKRFSRMQRFIGVFHALEEQPSNWVETALACGYYDQAHLIRDCKDFSGTTPAVLLAGETDLARHFYQSHASRRICTIRRGEL